MTVAQQTTYNTYTGNGVTTIFPYQFKILAAADLSVYSAGVLKLLGVDYTVSGVGVDVGGSVTFISGAPAVGAAVSLIRTMQAVRSTDYQSQGDFNTPTVNPDFDRPVLLVQDLQTQLNRSLRLPADEVGTLPTLPSKANRAGKYDAWDALGNPIASVGTGNDTALRTDLAITTAGGDGSRLSGYRRNTAGSVARSIGAKLDDLVLLSDWGTTQVALQAAADYAFANSAYLIGTNNLTVTLTSTLTLKCKGDLSMMTVQGNSTNFSPMVLVGLNSTATPIELRGEIKLPRVLNSAKVNGSGWAGFQVGVDLANLYEAHVFIPEVYGFDTGVWAGGYDEGFSYNHVDIRMLNNNKKGFRVGGKAGTGWANQNTFRLDRVFMAGSEGTNIAGARQILFAPFNVANNDSSWPNGNTIIGGSSEQDGPEFNVEIAGSNNILINQRVESPSRRFKITGHAAATLTFDNLLIGGVNSHNLVITTSGVVTAGLSVLNGRKSALVGDDVVMNMQNMGGSNLPCIQGFDTGAGNILAKSSGSTDWNFRLHSQKLEGKARTDANARIQVDFLNSVISTGSGAGAPTQVVSTRSTGWSAMTGAANKATVYDVATVTLAQLAGRVKALQDALDAATGHGLIGT